MGSHHDDRVTTGTNGITDTIFPVSGNATSVKACVERTLAEHPLFCGRMGTINLDYHQGILTISGRVPSFYLKQVVQEIVRHLDGVERVDNQIDVIRPDGVSSVRERPRLRAETR